MFAWTRTFYARSSDGIYYNFDMKRQRDDAVKNHGLTKVPAVEAYKHYKKIIQIPWEQYQEKIKYIGNTGGGLLTETSETGEKVCCNCRNNIRSPKRGDVAKIECFCAVDNHYIGYAACFSDCCEQWEVTDDERGNYKRAEIHN